MIIKNTQNYRVGDTVIIRRDNIPYDGKVVISPYTGLPTIPMPKSEYTVVEVMGNLATLEKVRDFES
jgi:hypothetical protein